MFSWLLQEVGALKERLAAMQEAHPMMPAQQTLRAPLGSPFGSPIGSVNNATFSSAQVCTPNAILLAVSATKG